MPIVGTLRIHRVWSRFICKIPFGLQVGVAFPRLAGRTVYKELFLCIEGVVCVAFVQGTSDVVVVGSVKGIVVLDGHHCLGEVRLCRDQVWNMAEKIIISSVFRDKLGIAIFSLTLSVPNT